MKTAYTPKGSTGTIIGKHEYAEILRKKKGIIVEENDPILKRFVFPSEHVEREIKRALRCYNNYVRRDEPEHDIMHKIENGYGVVIMYNITDIVNEKRWED